MDRDQPTTDYDERLRNLELTAMLGRMSEARLDATKKRLWGLALSGGGIRSATFALGVLQYLARRNMLGAFHYLSTVSGGGYIGAHLQAMLQRCGHQAATDALWPPQSESRLRWPSAGATSSTVQKLRRFTNFLSPDNASLSADRLSIGSNYLANLLLTLTQLSSLLLVFVLAPALLLLILDLRHMNPWWLGLLALACTVAAFAIRQRLPPLRRDRDGNLLPRPVPPQESASIRHLPPILLALSMIAMAYQFWYSNPEILDSRLFAPQRYTWPVVYGVGFLMWLCIWWQSARQDKEKFPSRVFRQFAFGALGVFGAFLLARLIQQGWLLPDWLMQAAGTPTRLLMTLAVGAPFLLVATFVLTLLHVGLAFTSEDRLAKERWARLMGVCALWVVTLSVLPALVAALVIVLMMLDVDDLKKVLTASFVGSGGAGLYVSRLVQAASRTGNVKLGRTRKLFKWALLWLFVLFVIVLAAAAAAATVLMLARHEGHLEMVTDFVALSDALAFLIKPGHLVVLLVPLIIWCVFAYFVDENDASMNTFYRNRLVRTYLGSANDARMGDPETDLDPDGDDIALADLRTACEAGLDCPCHHADAAGEDACAPERPLYPLLCATANLSGADERDWQDRKGASFFFSPLFCGHLPLQRPDARAIGDRPELLNWNQKTRRRDLRASDLAASTTLGTAMSISGAAISSSMGQYSSTALNFLLTLLNVRLGWWMENFNVDRFGPELLGKNLLSELLGMASNRGRYVYVSDGGHFENLGIYELVRRRCRFILSVDASADPDRDFEGLGNAIRKCRVDFGTDIDIDVSQIRPDDSGRSKNCAAVGKITYPDMSRGVLLYVKPSLLGNEPADIAHYAVAHAPFPHQPTSDQFFDESQFEAYRHLGYCCGSHTLDSVMSRMQAELDKLGGRGATPLRGPPIRLNDHGFKEQFLDELVEAYFEPASAAFLHFSRHGTTLAGLFDKLRQSPALRDLDRMLTPGWLRAESAFCDGQISPDPAPAEVDADAREEAPPLAVSDRFREQFYFMQQLIQLMESVYIDLDLERNHEHPNNRGWMNLFRQWTWCPMFRLSWKLTGQNRGSRFVRFCEILLRVPRFNDALALEWKVFGPGQPMSESWLNGGSHNLSFVEKSGLCSERLKACIEAGSVLGMANLQLSDFERERKAAEQAAGITTPGQQAGRPAVGHCTGIGVFLLTGGQAGRPTTLRLMRVQNHARRIGLGAKILDAIVEAYPTVRKVDIEAIDYGLMGQLCTSEAIAQKRLLQRMLDEAHLRAARPEPVAV